ncbi:hypothetical protein [Arhodomonas sp. AD133]|uniref:hypothetical protein n=1 Tax=Arhodomonas sp. AD133 TaxID=3415009 RepID=UPI003EBFF92A
MEHWYLLSGSADADAPQLVKVRAHDRAEALGKGRSLGFDEHSCVIDEQATARLSRYGANVEFLFRSALTLDEALVS